MQAQKQKDKLKLLFVLALGLIIWFTPVPNGLDPKAWKLFAIFATTIFSVLINAMPILAASLLALGLSVLTKTIEPKMAFSGFSQGFILLILTAFLIARGVIKSGLGKRIAFLMIKTFGSSSLGLAYSMSATDLLIAPAFPSNTARGGVLYPVIHSLASDSGSKVADGTRKKLGHFLMMNAIASLSISSGLWLTAMAANPIGVGIAKKMGVDITFTNWFMYSSVPSLLAFFIIPYCLYKYFSPELKQTPEAPRIAKEELIKMGPLSKNEWIMSFVFIAMVSLWAISALFNIDKTAVAFTGLAILIITKVFTLEDLKHQGDALGTFIWFAILYTLSSSLNHFGFMNYIGEGIANNLIGLSWQVVYVILILLYVVIHYFFVSQTAQLMALYGVFLSVGIKAQIPPTLIAMMLLLATNFTAAITPQGSSANIIFVGSGYLTTGEIYKAGALITAISTTIYLGIGTFWILLLL